MSYSLIMLPLAKRNLSKVVRERKDIDTKRALLAEISASFEKIRQRPRRYLIVYEQMRRAFTRRFHFAIFFRIIARPNALNVGSKSARKTPSAFGAQWNRSKLSWMLRRVQALACPRCS